MPSTSAKQKRFMEIAAHNPVFARKVGVPLEVVKELNIADKRNVTMNKIAARRNRQIKKGNY
jgi:hypothetical protein